jgi:hypothetical protein
MISSYAVERRKWAPGERGLYSGHLAVVLSLVWSLAILAIISKNHLVNSLWLDAAAFGFPIPIVLYFEHRIVRFGVLTCVAAIVFPLAAAVVFGI